MFVISLRDVDVQMHVQGYTIGRIVIFQQSSLPAVKDNVQYRRGAIIRHFGTKQSITFKPIVVKYLFTY